MSMTEAFFSLSAYLARVRSETRDHNYSRWSRDSPAGWWPRKFLVLNLSRTILVEVDSVMVMADADVTVEHGASELPGPI